MKVTRLELDGLILVEISIRGDERGFFAERFKHSAFRELGLPCDFRQDNHSRSAPGVLRGLHYQSNPPQGKLVGVTRGRIWDVAVDIRPHSKTFGRSHHLELSDVNGRLLWIPPGFAHGFCVVGDEPADVYYKVDQDYNPAGEGGILWSDPELAIPWPIGDPVVSIKDGALQDFAEYRARPAEWRRGPEFYEEPVVEV
ncbi:MAG TPA: dTDP-4-dehydrorhamnose 3,5-epimerase [Pyrinomonadaceae bacterium]